MEPKRTQQSKPRIFCHQKIRHREFGEFNNSAQLENTRYLNLSSDSGSHCEIETLHISTAYLP